MAEQVVSIDNKPLGLVWLWCPYPVLNRGLVGVLQEEARVHHGERFPEGRTPSAILVCVGGVEDARAKVASLRDSMQGATIVVFGMDNDLSLAQAALRAGARGFVHARMQPRMLIRAISVAVQGEYAVPRELLKDLLAAEKPVDLGVLTYRQREILEFVVEGQTNAQIGQELFLSESTIKQHLRAAYKVLKVRNRTEAARLLRESI